MSDFPTKLKCQMSRPLSLYRLSAIQISKQLWTQLKWKNPLILYIKKYNYGACSPISTHLKDIVCARITETIDDFILPESVKKELKWVSASMARRLLEWVHSLPCIGHRSVDLKHYIYHIHWTYYGSIDASATVRSMYLSKVYPKDINTWRELCRHCVEDCINDFWSKVSVREDCTLAPFRYIASVYWTYRTMDCLEEKLETLKTLLLGEYDEEFSLEENMFKYSFISDHYSTVKYFWKLLNNDQKKRMIIERAKDLIFNNRPCASQSDVIPFLLHQLIFYKFDYLSMKLLGCNDVLIRMLTWPYQSLFMTAVEELWVYDGSIDYTSVICEIIDYIYYSFSIAGADCQYREIFHGIWEKIVRNGRKSVNFLTVLHRLLCNKNITLLNYIINDPRLEEMRKTYISRIMEYFGSIVRPLDTDLLKEFVLKVLLSDEERERFRCDTVQLYAYSLYESFF